jgi:hypothetical protein
MIKIKKNAKTHDPQRFVKIKQKEKTKAGAKKKKKKSVLCA